VWRHITGCSVSGYAKEQKKDLTEYVQPENQTVMAFSKETGQLTSANTVGFSEERSRRRLSEMIVLDELPLSFVEKTGFQRFIQSLRSDFAVKSRRTMTRSVDNLYEEQRKEVQSFLISKDRNGRFSFTTDIWTSTQNLSYMSVTIHFLTKEMKLKKAVLSLRLAPSPHTGVHLAEMFLEVLQQWGVTERLMAITSDNATNNDTFFRCLSSAAVLYNAETIRMSNGNVLQVRCAGHVLNLLAKAGLKVIASSISRIRKAVVKIRSSPKLKQSFEGNISLSFRACCCT